MPSSYKVSSCEFNLNTVCKIYIIVITFFIRKIVYMVIQYNKCKGINFF